MSRDARHGSAPEWQSAKRSRMAGRGISWEQAFPYRGGSVFVTRCGNGWALGWGKQKVQASTLIDAFETLLGRRSGGEELRIVLSALDQDLASKPTRCP